MKKIISMAITSGLILLSGCASHGTQEAITVNGKKVNKVKYTVTDFPGKLDVNRLRKNYRINIIFEATSGNDLLTARYSRDSYDDIVNKKAKYRPYPPTIMLNNIKAISCTKTKDRDYGINPVMECSFSKSSVLDSYKQKGVVIVAETEFVNLVGRYNGVGYKLKYPVKITDTKVFENFLK